MPKFIDITGNRYGRLVVIKQLLIRNKHKRIIWECQCDCGNIIWVPANHMTTGRSKSCGCLRNELASNRWIKYLKDERALRYYFSSYEHSAKSRKLTFDITFECFCTLIMQTCFYCDRSPTLRFTQGIDIIANGIDRLDSNVGYTLDNCVAACIDCNLAKQSMNAIDFISLCQRVTDNWE